MKRRWTGSGRRFLITVMAFSLMPQAVRAFGDRPEQTVRLYRTGRSGPIGSVYSLGTVSLDGRRLKGEREIWGGEVIHALDSAGARVKIDSVCRAVLREGTIVRLAVRWPADPESIGALIVSVIQGTVSIRLEPAACAYVEGDTERLVSSPGASLRLERRDEVISALATNGSFAVQGRQPITHAEMFDVSKQKPISNPRKAMKLRPNESTTLALRAWTKPRPPGSSLTVGFEMSNQAATQASEPAAGELVQFTVIPPDLGLLDQQQKTTGPDGVAAVRFTAGPDGKKGQVEGIINPRDDDRPGTKPHVVTWNIEVVKPFWTTKNKILVALAIAGVVCIAGCKPEKKPLEQMGPPFIP